MVAPESCFSVWFDRLLSCLGFCMLLTQHVFAPDIAVNDHNEELRKEQTPMMPNVSDDFWSTSTYDLDERTSQILSSINTTNHISNHSSGSGYLNNHSDFVNHGLILWTQARLRWIGNGAKQTKKAHHSGLSWYMTKELLLETRQPFKRRIPLSEMVDFLVEEWEEEGLYF